MWLIAPARLHRPPGLEAGNAIRRHPFIIQLRTKQVPSIGIMPGKVQKVHAGEDCEESAEQRDGVDSITCIESLEENKGGA